MDTCYWIAEAANHTKSTQINPPITELITITIATATRTIATTCGNRNIVYADRSCCRIQRSGSFITFASKYVNMQKLLIFIVSKEVVV